MRTQFDAYHVCVWFYLFFDNATVFVVVDNKTKQIALCTDTDEKTNKYTEKWRGIVVDTEHKFSPPKRSRTFSHLFAKKMVK